MPFCFITESTMKLLAPLSLLLLTACASTLEMGTGTSHESQCQRASSAAVKTRAAYQDYYGTMLTSDPAALRSNRQSFRWGITNPQTVDMAYFAAYVKSDGKYRRFRTTLYADAGLKAPLVFLFRNNDWRGEVLKSITVEPGDTQVVDMDSQDIKKLFIGTELRINHGVAKKIIIGEPEFYNCK